MTKGRAPVLVRSALCGGEHITAVLNRASPDQHVPMRLAGLLGERGRNGDEGAVRFGERPIERGEAQVIADRQAEPTPRQIGGDRALSWSEAVRLAVALAAGEIDVEHMDLVIARHDLARRIDQE